jgi:hypothetical protein
MKKFEIYFAKYVASQMVQLGKCHSPYICLN